MVTVHRVFSGHTANYYFINNIELYGFFTVKYH